MQELLISIISGLIIWLTAKMVMKNDFKKKIAFFFFIKDVKDQDERIISYIFSVISIAIPIIVFLSIR